MGKTSISGVSEQPMGFDEIFKGVGNRVHSVKPNTTDIYVSIENGIVEVGGVCMDIAVVFVYQNGIVGKAISSGCSVSDSEVEQLRLKINTDKPIGDIVNPSDSKKPHSTLTNNRLNRQTILEQAILSAWGNFERIKNLG